MLLMSFLKISPNVTFNLCTFYQLLYFLSLQGLNFSDLFLHALALNFGYVTPHNIPNVYKNLHNFLVP
jgi:hypothetical protein